MKITIDTKEDSHDDIQKVLHILTSIIDRKDFDDPRRRSFAEPAKTETIDTANMMQMFDSPAKEEIPDTAPDFTAFLNLTRKKEEKKYQEPKIEFF